jgi:hypothetical protein
VFPNTKRILKAEAGEGKEKPARIGGEKIIAGPNYAEVGKRITDAVQNSRSLTWEPLLREVASHMAANL